MLGFHASAAASGCSRPRPQAVDEEGLTDSLLVPGSAEQSQVDRLVPEDGVAAAALLLAVGLCVFWAASPSAHPGMRSAGQSALLAPLGVVLRWRLGLAMNPAAGGAAWLPRGTLVANTAACLFDAGIYVWGHHAPVHTSRESTADVLMAGFGGALSTVSSAAAETAALFAASDGGAKARGYAYLTATFLSAFAPALAIIALGKKL